MTARAVEVVTWPLQDAPVVPHLLRWLAGCLAWLLLSVAAWLLLRRLSGALEQPLPAGGLLLLGLGVAGLLIAAEAAARRWAATAGRTRWLILHRLVLTVSGVALGLVVCLPGTTAATAAAFWLPVGGGLVWLWQRPRRLGRQAPAADEGQPLSVPPPEPPRVETAPAGVPLDEFLETEDPEEILLPPDVSQRIVRARDARGAELVHGTLRCTFVEGQRQQSVHVAFCPPLQAIAELSADQLAGPTAQIKTVMLETFGASLELKLAAPSRRPTDVQIQFFAFEQSPTDEGP